MKIEINQLLDKYWEGETSIEEEATLMQYFQSSTIEDSHQQFKPLFDWVAEEKQIQSPVTTDIDTLLDKYWEAETTVKEEETLKAYFNSGRIEERHTMYADLFGFYEDQQLITYSAPVKSLPVMEDKEKGNNKTRIIQLIVRVAAVAVLVVGAVFVINNMNNTLTSSTTASTSNVYEVEDPEEALRITREALALVSTKFRESQEPLKENLINIEKIDIFRAE